MDTSIKLGRFRLPLVWFYDDQAKLRHALRNVLIKTATENQEDGTREYWGIHRDFDLIEEGDIVPEYSWDAVTGRWHKDG